MKRFGKIMMLFAMINIILVGCNDEEPVPPHPIVGEWTLDIILLKNLPVGYSEWENYPLFPEEIILGLESLTITFDNNRTYSRIYAFPGPNESDNGAWEIIDETVLTLSPDGETFEEEYEIVGDIEELEMTLSETIQLTLLSDATLDDLITNYPLDDTLPEEEYAANEAQWDAAWDAAEAVTLDWWYIYER